MKHELGLKKRRQTVIFHIKKNKFLYVKCLHGRLPAIPTFFALDFSHIVGYFKFTFDF